jgi:hypothetical protein
MRKKVITRTINTTTCNAKVIDTHTNNVTDDVFSITGKHDEKSALKKLKSQYDNEDRKVIHVVSVDVKSALYGMDEDTFMNHAEIIDKKKEDKE